MTSGLIATNPGIAGEHHLIGNPSGSAGEGSLSGHLPSGGGSFDHGPTGGEGGDAQGGVPQDDTNRDSNSNHVTGPGDEHFGPDDSLGATAPDDSSSDTDDSTDTTNHFGLDPALAAEFEHAHLEFAPSHDDD